jgi:hypothetical protein
LRTHGLRAEPECRVSVICYMCDRNAGSIPNHPATGDPLATCATCGVLSCDGHGKRDPNVRRFQCVLCVPALLVAAALQQSESPALRLAAQVPLVDSQLLVQSLEEFLERWPDFTNIVTQSVRANVAALTERSDLGTRELWSSLTAEGHRLIAAAIIIAEHLELRAEDVPAVLRLLRSRWSQ